jgi:hypothetical protein
VIRFDDLPSAGASPERIADWIEFRVLTSKPHSVSRAELMSDLRISGTNDVLDSEWEISEDSEYEGIVDAVFFELDDRLRATGGEDGQYPFALGENTVVLRDGTENGLYAFLILVAFWSDENNGFFREGVKLFEEVSADAAREYVGANKLAGGAAVFGFPRRVLPAGFESAVTQLCAAVREGNGPNRQRPKIKDQKDAKLDIVAWTNFLDGRCGKLIAFGQCAAGNNWAEKTSELIAPVDWWTKWIMDRPGAWPIKMFFVPHRISMRDWLDVTASAGFLFDRCRIAHLAEMREVLKNSCTDWTSRALKKLGPK